MVPQMFTQFTLRNFNAPLHFFSFGFVVTLLVSLGGCAPRGQNPDRLAVARADRPTEWVTAQAPTIHDDILSAYGRYDDDALQGYVQRIGEQLAARSERPELIYRFTILDTADVNAFAVPASYVYLHRGILAHLDTEAELAAVLAHEIGHLSLGHAGMQLDSFNAPPKKAAAASNPFSQSNAATKQLFTAVGNSYLNGFGRDAEIEALRRASQYLARSGYDPHILINLVRALRNQHTIETTLAAKEKRTPSSYHLVRSTWNEPITTLVELAVAAGPPSARIGHIIRQEEFLEKLDGLTFADSARYGVRRGSRVYHPQINFSIVFPQDWTLQNQRARWIATAPTGDAFIQAAYQELDTALTAKEFITERLHLDIQSSGREFTAGNLTGYSVVTPVASPFGTRSSRFYVVILGNYAFVFVSVAQSDPIHTLYEVAFEQTVSSLHPLSTEEKLLAQPLRLKVISAKEEMTYRSLAEASPLRSAVEDQLRGLNHAYPDGVIHAGQWIKIVQ